MPRPELYPIKKVIGFNQGMIDAVDKWRAKQKPIPTVSDAIRRLLELGLEGVKVSRPKRQPTSSSASDLAGKQLDKLLDKTVPAEEQASRKRLLLKGPEEFREHRVDRKKAKAQ
jgi:hypothetical protein